MTGMTLFKLCQRQPTGGSALGLSCDEDGVFFAGNCALATPITDATGRRFYRARPLAEINVVLSAAYGRPVDFTDRMAGLRLAARYLTAGDWVLARIAAVQLRVPDLPDTAAALRLRNADELLRFNANHYPAGSSRGGQFAPAEDATMDAVDSSADVTRQKFSNEDDAARHALKYIYEASKRAGIEYAGIIYRNKDGTYGITAPTTEKDGNDQRRGVIRWSDVPDGAQPVATFHTHVRTNRPDEDERFSIFDTYLARERRVRSYIATPSGHFKVYDGITRSETDLGPLR